MSQKIIKESKNNFLSELNCDEEDSDILKKYVDYKTLRQKTKERSKSNKKFKKNSKEY